MSERIIKVEGLSIAKNIFLLDIIASFLVNEGYAVERKIDDKKIILVVKNK